VTAWTPAASTEEQCGAGPTMGIDFCREYFPSEHLGTEYSRTFAVEREYWSMKDSRMRVLDTHSSHTILMRGYFAKWGTSSC